MLKITIAAVATMLGILAAVFGLWDYVEPALGVTALAFSFQTFMQTRKIQSRKQSIARGDYYLVLQVGRPLTDAVQRQFGRVDAVVDVTAVLGTASLSTADDYEKLARALYSQIRDNQTHRIHVFLSGPVGLNFVIGQLVGLHHFNVVVYQFNGQAGQYEALPAPSREWLS